VQPMPHWSGRVLPSQRRRWVDRRLQHATLSISAAALVLQPLLSSAARAPDPRVEHLRAAFPTLEGAIATSRAHAAAAAACSPGAARPPATHAKGKRPAARKPLAPLTATHPPTRHTSCCVRPLRTPPPTWTPRQPSWSTAPACGTEWTGCSRLPCP
jgi:hypothetical protein